LKLLAGGAVMLLVAFSEGWGASKAAKAVANNEK